MQSAPPALPSSNSRNRSCSRPSITVVAVPTLVRAVGTVSARTTATRRTSTRTAATTTSMKPGTSGRTGGRPLKNCIMPPKKIKCAVIAHFVFCSIKTHLKSVSKKNGKFAKRNICQRFEACGGSIITPSAKKAERNRKAQIQSPFISCFSSRSCCHCAPLSGCKFGESEIFARAREIKRFSIVLRSFFFEKAIALCS